MDRHQERAAVGNSPHTQWVGDDLHGRRPVVTPVWVRLDAIYVRAPDAPQRTIPDGLDMTGEVRGHLYGWWPTVKGNWLGVVNFEIPYADGRRHKLEVREQLVPDYALRKRVGPRRPTDGQVSTETESRAR